VKLPGVQAEHDAAPTLALALPGSHDWQTVPPLDPWNVPGPQFVHELWPIAG